MRHIMGGPEERFLEAVNQSLWIAAIVVIFVAGLTSVLFARRLTSPIKHVTSAAKEIAAGRLDHRINVKSKDEIGELAGTFNNMAASLDKNQRLNRQLLAGIAHELRTPLTIIQGNLEAILDGVQEATPEKIAALHTETVLVNRLVNDLRELTLAEAGQLRLATQEVDLKVLALNVTEMLQPMLSEKAIKLTVKMPDSLPGANADPDRVTQVLYNLLTNAIRHTGAKGKIDISAAKLDNMVSVSVKDNGEGMPEDELPLIFDHFYRVDEARARATGGTGMGLAITRLLVEAHGGNISVTSSPGKGTEFTFTLPISY
jgi:signal transduction histidine kinase